jgi:signal peptidase I
VAAVLVTVATSRLEIAWVVGGSMEPSIAPGDLVVASPEARVRPGDVVLFSSEGDLVVHRVVSMRRRRELRTRGDANGVADAAPVRPEDVLGRVILVLPTARLVGWALP